jgi:hypothetical protein
VRDAGFESELMRLRVWSGNRETTRQARSDAVAAGFALLCRRKQASAQEGRPRRGSRAGQSQHLRRESHQPRFDLSQELRLEISRTLLPTAGQGAESQQCRAYDIALNFGGALASAPVLLAPRGVRPVFGRKPGPLVERKFRPFGAETGAVRR